jgi:hypothetical protein
MIDQQHIVGRLLDRAGDALAVLRPEHERAQDQDVERALQQRQLFRAGLASGFHLTQACALVGLDVNPSQIEPAACMLARCGA